VYASIIRYMTAENSAGTHIQCSLVSTRALLYGAKIGAKQDKDYLANAHGHTQEPCSSSLGCLLIKSARLTLQCPCTGAPRGAMGLAKESLDSDYIISVLACMLYFSMMPD